MCSKRAAILIEQARLAPSYKAVQFVAPASTNSAVPTSVQASHSPWWDEISEAADVPIIKSQASNVKRRLFFSPVKYAALTVELGAATKEGEASLPALPINDNANDTELSTCTDAAPETEVEKASNYLKISSTALPAITKAHHKIVPRTVPPQSPKIPSSPSQCNIELCDNGLQENNYVIAVEAYSEMGNNINRNSQVHSMGTDMVAANPNVTECTRTPNRMQEPANNIDTKTDGNKMYPSHLKIHEAKLALNSGREHVTSKGNVRHARQVKLPCKDTCLRCQKPKFSLDGRQKINQEFWSLKDHLQQWMYIKQSLEIVAPKRKMASKGAKGEKLSSRVYYFSLSGVRKKVCKTMFKNTLSICDSWIDSAISHCSVSAVEHDGRGRHTNRPKRKSNV